jgi:hypothetical protein
MTRKTNPVRKPRQQSHTTRAKRLSRVTLVATTTPLRHLRLVSHPHSGKLIHHQHTSHVALLLMLLFVGVMMLVSFQVTSATSGTLNIGAVVNGPPPSVGATITSPVDGATITDQTLIPVSGTCAPSTFVIVYANDVLAGSTHCTIAGIFSLKIDLQTGVSILSALNFDNANQPGPVTSSTRVTLNISRKIDETKPTPTAPLLPGPQLPLNPSVIPGIPGVPDGAGENCETYTANKTSPAGGKLALAVVCIPRIVEVEQLHTMTIIVRGGVPPYAIKIDHGYDQGETLVSVAEPGVKPVRISFARTGAFNVQLFATDQNGATTLVETAVLVKGAQPSIITVLTDEIATNNWLTSSVPVYVVALVSTLAFWIGDIFNRRFGSRASTWYY